MSNAPHLVTLGMFIIDEFEYLEEQGSKTGKTQPPQESHDTFVTTAASSYLTILQIGGGGTYAAIGARIWIPAQKIGMIVDRGSDFPADIQEALYNFGSDMWLFRDDPQRGTTRAINLYRGEQRGFQYLTPRVRLTPKDLEGTKLAKPANLHFICSPARAADIVSEINAIPDWDPVTIFEPIPDRCVPEELPALIAILPAIEILSPNAEEALSLLSLPQPPTKAVIEQACARFLDLGIGRNGQGYVVIRSGGIGAYVASRTRAGLWVEAFWSEADADKIIDVTGAGNSFLGGLSAGLLLAEGDVYRAVFYATVSASFVIEQLGLPRLNTESEGSERHERWNGDDSFQRLAKLQHRHATHKVRS